MADGMIRVGSVFSGVGGLDAGLELAGVGRTVFQVEIDEYASSVLERHWPDIVHRSDIRRVSAADLPPVEILAGGSPCQGFSQAGKRKGFCDPRSALWKEMFRLTRGLRPRVVIFENVAGMLQSGQDKKVASDLRSAGYEVHGPLILDAAAFGAPHKMRVRVFLVAVLPGTKMTFPPIERASWVYPRLRGSSQRRSEAPRTLEKATRYPGVFKRERLHALGNAVMPEMGYIVGLYLRQLVGGEDHGIDLMTYAKASPSTGRWPTPVTTDAKGSRRATARKAHWKSQEGVTLTDAVWLEGERNRPLNPEWVEQLMGFPRGFTLA